jgi:two-component system response regulator PilR (NtrC family)
MEVTTVPSTKKCILYVDGFEDSGELFNFILTEDGYKVEVAHSLIEALQLIENRQFNLCVVDIFLPDGSGLKFLEKIHAIYPSMPIIICSAYRDDSTQQQALLAGAIAYFPKPVNFELLVQFINLLLKSD